MGCPETISLTELRKRQGFTQKRLGTRLGVKQPTISRIEKRWAQGKPLPLPALERLVRALGARMEVRVTLSTGEVVNLEISDSKGSTDGR